MAGKDYTSDLHLNEKQAIYLVSTTYLYQGLIALGEDKEKHDDCVNTLLVGNVFNKRELMNKSVFLMFIYEMRHLKHELDAYLPHKISLYPKLEKEKKLAVLINVTLNKSFDSTFVKSNSGGVNLEIYRRPGSNSFDIEAGRNEVRMLIKTLDFSYYVACGEFAKAFNLIDHSPIEKSLIDMFIPKFESAWRKSFLLNFKHSLSHYAHETKKLNREIKAKILSSAFYYFMEEIDEITFRSPMLSKACRNGVYAMENTPNAVAKKLYDIDDEFCFYYFAVIAFSLSEYDAYGSMFAKDAFAYISGIKRRKGNFSLLNLNTTNKIKYAFGEYLKKLGLDYSYERSGSLSAEFTAKELIKYG